MPEIGSLAQVQLAMVRVSFEIFIHDSHQPDFIARQKQKQKRAKDRSKILKRKAYMQEKTNQAIRAVIKIISPIFSILILWRTYLVMDHQVQMGI